jgi:hypothetical protein
MFKKILKIYVDKKNKINLSFSGMFKKMAYSSGGFLHFENIPREDGLAALSARHVKMRMVPMLSEMMRQSPALASSCTFLPGSDERDHTIRISYSYQPRRSQCSAMACYSGSADIFGGFSLYGTAIVKQT